MSKNKYEWGEESELDKLRTEVNLSKVIKNQDKKFRKKVRKI